jgi:8-oxo-dGTP diphosphatase
MTSTTETTTGHGDHRELVGYAADVLATRRHPETGDAEILMIRRGHYPHEGAWATPGGYVDHHETAQAAAAREAAEETHLAVNPEALAFVGVYDAPGRDPRGRVVGTAWHLHLIGEDARFEPVADDDAAAAQWVSIDALLSGEAGPVAFDHQQVVADAIAKYPIPAAHDLAVCDDPWCAHQEHQAPAVDEDQGQDEELTPKADMAVRVVYAGGDDTILRGLSGEQIDELTAAFTEGRPFTRPFGAGTRVYLPGNITRFYVYDANLD